MATLTEKITLNDVLQWEVDYQFTREVVIFRNATAGALSYVMGLLCEIASTKYVPNATAANVVSVLLAHIDALAATTDKNVLMLVRGPAIINKPVTGVALSGYNNVAVGVQDGLLAAKNIIMKLEPTQQTEIAA